MKQTLLSILFIFFACITFSQKPVGKYTFKSDGDETTIVFAANGKGIYKTQYNTSMMHASYSYPMTWKIVGEKLVIKTGIGSCNCEPISTESLACSNFCKLNVPKSNTAYTFTYLFENSNRIWLNENEYKH